MYAVTKAVTTLVLFVLSFTSSERVCFPDGMRSDVRIESSLYGTHDYVSHGDFTNRRAMHVKSTSKELFDLDALMVYVFTHEGCSAYPIPEQLSFYPCLPDDSQLESRYQVRGRNRKGWRYVTEWSFTRPFTGADYSISDDLVTTFMFVIDEVTGLPDMYILEFPDGTRDKVVMNATTFDYEGTDIFDLDISDCITQNIHTEL